MEDQRRSRLWIVPRGENDVVGGVMKKIARNVFYKMDSSIVLMFHHVTKYPRFLKSGCVLSTNNFVNVLDVFSEYISCNDLVLSPSKKLCKGKVAVTFDDGLEDVYNIAYPILSGKNIPFTLFVVNDYLDTQGYISKDQLVEMSENPLVTIGAHGVSHDILTQLSDDEKWNQISNSRTHLEELIGKSIRLFAYSHGQFDRTCRHMVKQAGYDAAFSTRSIPINRISLLQTTILPRYSIIDDNFRKVTALKSHIMGLK